MGRVGVSVDNEWCCYWGCGALSEKADSQVRSVTSPSHYCCRESVRALSVCWPPFQRFLSMTMRSGGVNASYASDSPHIHVFVVFFFLHSVLHTRRLFFLSHFRNLILHTNLRIPFGSCVDTETQGRKRAHAHTSSTHHSFALAIP